MASHRLNMKLCYINSKKCSEKLLFLCRHEHISCRVSNPSKIYFVKQVSEATQTINRAKTFFLLPFNCPKCAQKPPPNMCVGCKPKQKRGKLHFYLTLLFIINYFWRDLEHIKKICCCSMCFCVVLNDGKHHI